MTFLKILRILKVCLLVKKRKTLGTKITTFKKKSDILAIKNIMNIGKFN